MTAQIIHIMPGHMPSVAQAQDQSIRALALLREAAIDEGHGQAVAFAEMALELVSKMRVQ